MERKKPTALRNFILIGIVLLLGYSWITKSQYEKILKSPLQPGNEETQNIIIQKGSSAETVGKLLEEKNIIADGKIFKKYIKDIGQAEKLIAGRFTLSSGQTIPEISLILTDPSKAQNVLTVPEGFTVSQIDERLTEMEVIERGEFTAAVKTFNQYDLYPFLDSETLQNRTIPLEGYLFPDTYFLDAGDFSSEDIIQLMLKTFEKKVVNVLNLPPEKLDDTVLVASLLEKEIRTERDLPIVSGIIWKREENGWFLNIDATLLYEKKIRAINKEDDSPYNTYKTIGFPPGPIGNPGIKTLQAAANPQSSPYWFYLTKPKTGEVVYATTNEQHNANRAKWLQ